MQLRVKYISPSQLCIFKQTKKLTEVRNHELISENVNKENAT